MNKNVYITRLSKFLPNSPVSNEDMEDYLGLLNDEPSVSKGLVLRNNRIKTRYYALDKQGRSTHSNAELAAEAVKNLTGDGFTLNDIELLSCGTTSADQLLPSHASMVHGLLSNKPLEIFSASGSCNAGMQALKFGYLSVLSGNSQNAVCCASEKLSVWMHARNFEQESGKLKELKNNPYIAFEKEFLRWMLSDGAGAALLTDTPDKNKISFKIEWIDLISYANELETCMYAGAVKNPDGKLSGWREFNTREVFDNSVLSLAQDVRLLGKNIVRYGTKCLRDVLKKHDFDINSITYFLPHISSEFFRKKIAKDFEDNGLPIPEQKWFTNLTTVGNVAAASPYLILEELYNSTALEKNDKILIAVPESARFSYCYVLLSVV